eukprot:4401020-Amphidinium_carterae.2
MAGLAIYRCLATAGSPGGLHKLCQIGEPQRPILEMPAASMFFESSRRARAPPQDEFLHLACTMSHSRQIRV